MPIHYDIDGSVARFTIDNGRLNIMTGEMYEQLFVALSRFIADENLKVGIICGSDAGNFCAGDDIKSSPRPSHSVPRWPTAVSTLRRDKPIIAAADGWSLGAGFHLLLVLSDIRVATPEARFGFPEISYGMGGAGGASRLGRQLPHAIAMQMLMTGEYLSAEQALKHSLVNEIITRDELQARANELAEKVAEHPLLAIQTEMNAYYAGNDLSPVEAVHHAASLYRFQRKLHEMERGGPADVEFKGDRPMKSSGN